MLRRTFSNSLKFSIYHNIIKLRVTSYELQVAALLYRMALVARSW
ncbi:hypothetical protein BACINT_03119 [Bacteroides intestinalis DSM 17393]|uniref:Uncharacterized protein n=1 Tax=Bacteroides intestinalis DSM 17393 TaxID=471870 RepID=B3CI34_9BACE|nr:hypothetical protein BACINT_03119 [Bacteroides intestinalis DSM 17393]